jgi:hypothetical protein
MGIGKTSEQIFAGFSLREKHPAARSHPERRDIQAFFADYSSAAFPNKPVRC